MSSRIEDYGLIGDCTGAALVGRDGSVDWLCWPRLDSEACFAALVGTAEHGRWQIAPADAFQSTRQYRPDTLILETTFETQSGRATVIDFMIHTGPNSHFVRVVRGDSGQVDMTCELILRFGYGATIPWVTRLDDGTLRAIAGPDMVVLRTPVQLRGENLKTVGRFSVQAGNSVPFLMSWGFSHRTPPEPVDAEQALSDCETQWRIWIAEGSHNNTHSRYSDAVKRSLITLKALTFAPTGGIVAAPTTSLPEQFGGSRNWDYRFCWVRDATFTLLTLMNCGYYREAGAWRDWLERAVAGDPGDLRVIYGLMGERRLTEWEVSWLPGYENAHPVRIGNAAHAQFQLDIYGELMDAFEQGRRGGLATSESGWSLQLTILKHLKACWHDPDQGIWEMRGPPQHFTFSRAMAWVAFDRCIQAVEQHGLDGPAAEWRTIREEIRNDILARGYNASGGHFQMSYEYAGVDASLLLLPQIGFIKPDDPKFVGTVRAIERDLLHDGFVRRYDTGAVADGLPEGEATFLACTCWLADAYAMLGEVDKATALLDRVLAIRNDLGLLAEEYDTKRRRHAGNFPQAFSHVALVNTILNLTRVTSPLTQRARRTPSAAKSA